MIIFGAGRLGPVVYDILQAQGTFKPQAFLDDAVLPDLSHEPIPILGGMEWARAHAGESIPFIVAIGNNSARVRISTELRGLGFQAVNAIHPSAVIMSRVSLGT